MQNTHSSELSRVSARLIVGILAGNELVRPSMDTDSVVEFVKLAIDHRVVGRVLERLLGRDTTGELVERLALHHCQTMATQRHRQEHCLGVLDDLREVARTFVLVKGLSVFEATKNPFVIRDSSDMDVVVRPSADLRQLVQRFAEREYKAPAPHEALNLNHEGVHIDFHKHFPVWVHEPQDLNHGDAPFWVQGGQILRKEMDFDAILANSSRESRSSVEVFRPRVACAAFIQIAHFYRDLMRLYVPGLVNRPRVRIQEILDIRDLITSDRFVGADLLALVDEYDAREQATICGQYIYAITGNDDLLRLLGCRERSQIHEPMPVRLALWYGFTLVVAKSPWAMLFEKVTAATIAVEFPSNAAVLELGARWSLDMNGAGHICLVVGDMMCRAVAVALEKSEFVVSVDVATRETRLRAPPSAFVAIGDIVHHFDFAKDEPRERYPFLENTTVADKYEEEGNEVRFEVRLPLRGKQPKSVGAVICVGEVDEVGRLLRGVMVPIHLSLR